VKRRVSPFLAGPAFLLALYLVLPFVAGVQQAELANWRGVDVAALEHACAVSAASASIAAVLIAAGGIPLGYWLARTPTVLARVLGFVVQLPLALPPLASGVLLLFLVGPFSPVSRLVGDVTDTFGGIVIAETFVAAPFLIIAARSAFEAVDPVLEDVAATLGHKKLARFALVSLPLAWPTILAGLLLAWLRAFGEFGATVMVAYHPYSLPVYTYVAFGAQGLPAMLPVVLPTLVVAGVVMALSVMWQGSYRPGPTIPVTSAQPLEPVGDWALSRVGEEGTLAFQFHAQVGTFRLDTNWSPQSRRLAILGPSGSGKSLTLKLLAGLEAPEQGFVRIGGKELTGLAPEERGIAYVPQNYGLLPNRSVRQQLLFAVGASVPDVDSCLARFGLRGLEERRPPQLSLGQQQRVAMARALVRPARLILMDEPFSALDAPLRGRLRRELRELQRGISATTIIVTHDPEEAMLLADEVLVMDQGRVLQSGDVREVARNPINAHVASLLGAGMLSQGTAIAADWISIGNGVSLFVQDTGLRPGTPVVWTVRREFVRVGKEGRYRGRIEEVTCIGDADEALVRIGDARVRALMPPGLGREGECCMVDIDPRAVLIWSEGGACTNPEPMTVSAM
jgi:molybdate transport system permease protein